MARWGGWQWPHMLMSTLALLFPCHQPPTVVGMQCNDVGLQVPAPELKYVPSLPKDIVVTWKAYENLRNISALYCCHQQQPDFEGKCHHICPRVKRIEGCSVRRNDMQLAYSCSFKSTGYLDYFVYLSAKVDNCVMRSVNKTITPNLLISYPKPVTSVTLSSTKEELLARWRKGYESYSVRYNLTWYEIAPDGHTRTRLLHWINRTNELSMRIPMTSDIQPYTVYECCVKSCFILDPTCKYSLQEMCDRTRTPEAAPSKPPEFLCGIDNDCSQELKGDYRNVTLIWKLPEQVYWNGVSKRIVVDVHDSVVVVNRSTEHYLNGTATQHTLTMLHADHTYNIYVKMCTSGGCSTISTPVVLYPVKTQEQAVAVQRFNFKMIVIFVTVIVIMIFLTLILCFLWDTKRNTDRRPVAGLPRLQEPVVRDQTWSGGDSIATSIFVNAGDYDFLCNEQQQHQEEKEGSTCFRGVVSDHDLNHTHEYETTPMGSVNGDCHSPLLRPPSVSSMDRSHVIVTYLPQSMDTSEAVEEVKEAQTEFTVKLASFDEGGKIKLIKEVKNLMEGMNLVQAKKFVENVPQVLKEDISKDEAEKLKTQLEALGGKVEIE